MINESLSQRILDLALSQGADFAEIYVEDTRRNQYSFLDRQPQKAISGHTLGAGIRIFSGHEQIYTFTNDLSEKGLLQATTLAVKALKASGQRTSSAATLAARETLVTAPARGDLQQKIWNDLATADEAARGLNHLITQVQAEMLETVKTVLVINSEGVHRQEARSYLNASVVAYSEENGATEQGYERTGFLGSINDWERVNMKTMALEAAGQSLRILRAEWAPAGEMPVVIDNGFGGVIFHEACGHGLETTSVARNASVFCDKLGQKVANECVTAIDDGTIEGSYGSLEIDDEGMSTQRTVLIENGILKNYIADKMGARKTGFKPTGSARRQDYRFAPTSRMRNTFIGAGTSNLEEMIRDVDYGLYAKRLGGGSVSPGTGSYNFAVPEAFLIRNGRIQQQVKGASLIGTGIETLGRITKVSSDLKLAPGTCGSSSGMIPVTVGQPQILVSQLTVGGKV
jgi:TldD protein